jgi:hypothetical protein
MIYLLPTGSSMLDHPEFYGIMCQPRSRSVPLGMKEGRAWAFDNDCFNGGFNVAQWWTTLQKFWQYKRQCLFVALPDVVGDALATKSLWYQWLPTFRSLGVPLAYVAQNGQGDLAIPEHAAWVFLGGDNEFKLGQEGREVTQRARAAGLKVHMGRVNSERRLRYAKMIGADSVDGTFICFGKDINTPKLNKMMRRVRSEQYLPLY